MVHKIKLKLEEEILGLIAIQDFPNELRLHIKLLENAKHSRGKEKTYKQVAGCLIAHTCQMAFEKDYDDFVSLHPKTALEDHYHSKYGFKEMGIFIYTELDNSEKLIKKYLNDGE